MGGWIFSRDLVLAQCLILGYFHTSLLTLLLIFVCGHLSCLIKSLLSEDRNQASWSP